MTYVYEPSDEELRRFETDARAMLAFGRGVDDVRAELRRKALSPERIEQIVQAAVGAREGSVKADGKRDVIWGAVVFVGCNGVAVAMFAVGRFGGLAAFVGLSLVGVALAARGIDRLRRGGQAS